MNSFIRKYTAAHGQGALLGLGTLAAQAAEKAL
jgi:hypothetical protein